jgi:hypothetical protein
MYTYLNIYDITSLVNLHVSRKVLDSMFSELFGEQVTSSSSVTLSITHALDPTKERIVSIRHNGCPQSD